jgi:hypothetical protein
MLGYVIKQEKSVTCFLYKMELYGNLIKRLKEDQSYISLLGEISVAPSENPAET